jgi:hypothetical protein
MTQVAFSMLMGMSFLLVWMADRERGVCLLAFTACPVELLTYCSLTL